MAGVSASLQAVANAISICKATIQSYNSTSQTLGNKYKAAGAGWADGKYAQLGEVVKECQKALNNPVKELDECVKKLETLYKAIEDYEKTKI